MLPTSGVLGMLALAGALCWVLMDTRDPVRPRVFLFVAAIPLYGLVCERLLAAESALFPMKYDLWLYGIDGALGVDAQSIARAVRVGPMVPLLAEVYRLLLIAMALGYGSALRRGGPSILTAYLVEMVCGPLLYALLPACGPYYALPGFPNSAANPAFEMMQLPAAPNAVPSLHMSTAVLLVLFARTGPGRAGSALFAAATALATLVTGEHYAIDLIVGLPFGCFAAAVARREWRVAAWQLGTVAAWMLAVRTAGPALAANPLLLRWLALVTIASALYWSARPAVATAPGKAIAAAG